MGEDSDFETFIQATSVTDLNLVQFLKVSGSKNWKLEAKTAVWSDPAGVSQQLNSLWKKGSKQRYQIRENILYYTNKQVNALI